MTISATLLVAHAEIMTAHHKSANWVFGECSCICARICCYVALVIRNINAISLFKSELFDRRYVSSMHKLGTFTQICHLVHPAMI